MLFNKVKLPTTVEDYDKLVYRVCDKYGFKDARHIAAVISRVVKHIAIDQDWTTLDYIKQNINKSYANHVATFIAGKTQHEAQIDGLVDMIKQDPLNQQAWDELTKFSDSGSPKAKEALEKLNEKHLSVVKPIS